MACSTERPLGLSANTLTPEAFAPFGTVIQPRPDGDPWREDDAVLQFEGGPPRLYLMALPNRGLTFTELARHQQVTQALGAVDDQPWFLVVARPDHPADRPFNATEDLHAFCIPPHQLVVLHVGTWHAGPLFIGADERVFLNLESRTTNINDLTILSIDWAPGCVVKVD